MHIMRPDANTRKRIPLAVGMFYHPVFVDHPDCIKRRKLVNLLMPSKKSDTIVYAHKRNEAMVDKLPTQAELITEIDRLRAELATRNQENTELREQLTAERQRIERLLTPDLQPNPLEEAPSVFPGAREADPLEFLREHYGYLLTYFGAQEDRLYQHHLRQLDENLLRALENRLHYLRRKKEGTTKLADVVPVDPARPHGGPIRRDLSEYTVADLLDDPAAAATVLSRARSRARSRQRNAGAG